MLSSNRVVSGSGHVTPKKLFLSIIRSCRLPMAVAMIFSMFSNMSMLVMPLYMFLVMDKFMISKNMSTLVMLYIIALVALSFTTFMDVMKNRVMVYVGTWIDKSIARNVLSANFFAALSKSNSASHEVTQDIIEVRQFFSGHTMMVFMDVPWVPFLLAFIFIFDLYLGLVAVAAGIVLMAVSAIQRYWVVPNLVRAERAMADSNKKASDLLRNADTAEAMGMRQQLIKRWRMSYNKAMAKQERSSIISGTMSAIAKILRLLFMMITMTVAMVQIMDPNSYMTIGALMAAVIMINRILTPLEQAVSQFQEFGKIISVFDRIAMLLDRHFKQPQKAPLDTIPRGHVQVDQVSVIVPNNKRIVDNVSFRLEPGEIVGVVGPSGAGKSTLGRVLVGILEPHEGAVYLDGMDLKNLRSEDYGQYFGYVSQDVTLFDATLAQNISRYELDPDPNDIIAAAKNATLHDAILRMPKGYDTQLGARGIVLSGGQRQRVALARALYRAPRLLVLDEPNSNLDAVGEEALFNALEIMKKQGAAVLVIAHRPNVLRIVDRIVYMDKGRIQRIEKRQNVNSQTVGQQPAKKIPDKSASENSRVSG